MLQLGFFVFWVWIVLLELTYGVAYVGPIGGISYIEREKSPVFYWMIIAIQIFLCSILPFAPF